MAYTEFYCVPGTGSNVNAGSTTGAPAFSFTNGNWNATTFVYTVTSGTITGVAVGDWASIYIDGATTAVYIARITAVTSTTVTVSNTAKSGTAPTTSATGRTIKVGGAWAGPSGANGFPLNFITGAQVNTSNNPPRVNFKNNSTYSISAAITCASVDVVFQGYTTTVGDGGKAILDGGTTGASYILTTFSGNGGYLSCWEFRNNGSTGSADGIVVSGARFTVHECIFHDLKGNGLNTTGADNLVLECEAYFCNTSNTAALGGISVGGRTILMRCTAHDNSGANNIGFYINNSASLLRCIAAVNGRYGMQVALGSTITTINNCVAYGNVLSGIIYSNTGGTIYIENSIMASNANAGFQVTNAASLQVFLRNNAYYNNTSGNNAGLTNASVLADEIGSITLGASPFTNPAVGDFTLNNTSNGGTLCKRAGVGQYTETGNSWTTVVSYPDIGAMQHKDDFRNVGIIVGGQL
jgi:hypothetical protein